MNKVIEVGSLEGVLVSVAVELRLNVGVGVKL